MLSRSRRCSISPSPSERTRAIEPGCHDLVETGHLDLDLVAERELELVEVHPTRFVQDWFGTWSNRYERPPAPGGFLQIVPPASWFCESHASATPRLDRPGHDPDGNRATRRRRR